MFRIIDSHAHIFPDKIAEKASANIGAFYDISMKYDGTLKTLLEVSGKAGVEQHLVHSVATTPSQVEQINTYIAESVAAYPQRLIGFATMHPGLEHIGEEVERAISLGLSGIKLHPDFQRFSLDDKAAYQIYEAAEGRLPILTHTGDTRHNYSHPSRIPTLLKDFPKLRLICAHFGGWSQWQEGEQYLRGLDLWVDTSSSFYALDNRTIEHLISRFGEDRVLFGTDYPMWDPGCELDRFYTLHLSDGAKEKILCRNLCDLLGIQS